MVNHNSGNKLPIVLESVHQEDRSIIEISMIVSQSKLFLVRQETKKDYGVDLRFELLLDKKYASNYKIDVQLKDVQEARKFNIDNTYSYQIKISTLNYLTNSINSLFIIYLEDNDIFLWDWCYNIREFVDKSCIDFYNQNSITYRFSKQLNERALNDIFNEVKAKYEKMLNSDKYSILKNINQNNSDINISVNSMMTKYNLKIIFNYLINNKQIGVLSSLTLYDLDELFSALENGIMTARLAEGIKRIFDIDLQYLCGTCQIDEVFLLSLEVNHEQ